MKSDTFACTMSLVFGLGLLAALPVGAATYTWIGPSGTGGGGSWQTATNWDPEGVPGTDPDDTATIPNL